MIVLHYDYKAKKTYACSTLDLIRDIQVDN